MVKRKVFREYARGSLWVMPGAAGVLALLVGFGISKITIDEDSPFEPLAFQGTADDARALLSSVTSTVVTVIALVLGLTVVALQLSSTQFSPRLIRNFLRDRPNQLVLSVFVATFVYSAAGLYTVGESGGDRTQSFPRLAVSGSIALLFASFAMVVYFADHLVHSIRVEAIGKTVEVETVTTAGTQPGVIEQPTMAPPPWAMPVLSRESGYLQAVDPGPLLAVAGRYRVHLQLRPRVGQHVVAGTVLAWLWPSDPGVLPPDPQSFREPIEAAVKIGFERTLEQDVAFGIRQLVDMACKALSPAVNDPYTAVQSVDHLSVIFCTLAVRPLGDEIVADVSGAGVVIIPGRRFGEYLDTMCGLIRRYGSSEPTVSLALLQLLSDCAFVLPAGSDRRPVLLDQAELILQDATRDIAQPRDLVEVTRAVAALRAAVDGR